jgi:hypothetical protein
VEGKMFKEEPGNKEVNVMSPGWIWGTARYWLQQVVLLYHYDDGWIKNKKEKEGEVQVMTLLLIANAQDS